MLINMKYENTEFGYPVMHKNISVPEIQYNSFVMLTPIIIRTVKHPVRLLNFKPTRLTFHLMGLDKCCRYTKSKIKYHSAY